jgi:hypothetical protein
MNKMIEILDKAYDKLIPNEKTARKLTENYMKMYNIPK